MHIVLPELSACLSAASRVKVRITQMCYDRVNFLCWPGTLDGMPDILVARVVC
jgi:hypothetical protein